MLGLAWAADNRWAPALAKNPNTKFYHHWEMRNVPELSRAGISYVPTYWGDKKAYNWPATKALFGKYRYKRALFVNEPDIPSQSDYTPARAAGAFMREMVPLRQKYGTKLSSPQICYNVDWLASWLRIMKQKGQSPDFLAVHYYGGWNSVGQLKSYISGIHNRWPHYKIWITEFGVTSASRPSAAQVKQFFVDSVNWFGSQDYVEAVFPFGIWAQAPDSYGSQQNAAFWDNGALRTLGEYWAHVNPAKRSLLEQEPAANHRAIRRHHALIERIIAREPSPEEEKWDDVHPSNATDCDESKPALQLRLPQGVPRAPARRPGGRVEAARRRRRRR